MQSSQSIDVAYDSVLKVMQARDFRGQIDTSAWHIEDTKKQCGVGEVTWERKLHVTSASVAERLDPRRKRLGLSIPLSVGLCLPFGRPGTIDLRLQLLDFKFSESESAGGHYPEHISATRRQRRMQGHTRSGMHPPEEGICHDDDDRAWWPHYRFTEVVQASAALLMALVMLPDQVGPAIGILSRRGGDLHAAAALGGWTGRLLRDRRRRPKPRPSIETESTRSSVPPARKTPRA